MILGLSADVVALGLAIALLAGVVRGLAGFELAILLVPVLGLVATPQEAVVAANWLGVLLLGITPPGAARLLIALIAIAAFVAVLLPPKPADHRPSAFETGATGVTSGLLTGFAGMPGPPVAPYYLRRALPPTVARSSMLAVFVATSLAGAGSALALGVADWTAAVLALMLWPAIIIGNWLGFREHDRVLPRLWRWVTGATMGAAAAMACAKLLA